MATIQNFLDRIEAAEQSLSEIIHAIESLNEKRQAIIDSGKECYKDLYDYLDPQPGSYFASGTKLVIINRQFSADIVRAISIQPLTNS